MGALVRGPDESILPCFLPGGARGELILFPNRIREGGGRILVHQRGSVKFGVKRDWGGAVWPACHSVTAIPRGIPWHYNDSLGLGLGIPLQGIFTQYSLFPPFQSSATGPACPVGGGEVGVDLAKEKNSYPRRGIRGMLRSLLLGRNDRALGRAYSKDRYDDANGLGGEELLH